MKTQRPKNTQSQYPSGLFRILAAFCLLIVLAESAPLEAQTPLYLQEPFDRITLNEQNDNAELIVRTLDLPDRKLPQSPAPTDTLKFRLLDAPQKLYELQWQHIVKVQLFETMLLDEARNLVEKGHFGAAYDYFRVLRARYPKLPGVEAAYDACLLAEARQAHRDQKYDAALVSLLALRDRNPKLPELPTALTVTVEKLVEKHVAAECFSAARRLLEQLAAWNPDQPLVAKYQAQFQQQTADLLSQAKAALQAGKHREADQTLRRARQIWPKASGLKELAQQVHAKYPRAVIGVSTPAENLDPQSLDDWAARRAGRMVARPLVLFAGPGAQGGNYLSPVGHVELDKSLRRVEIRLRNDVRWSRGEGVLTGFDAARALLAMSDPAKPEYLPGADDLLERIQVYDVWRVEIGLRHASPRPEAFLSAVLQPYTDPALLAESRLGCGPYLLDSRRDNEVTYVANDRHPGKPMRPKELTEICFREPGKALAALNQGQIQAIDRLCPWELGAARALKHVNVQVYAVPTVHCLLPNFRRPLPADRRFRRAVVYGIDRETVLNRLTAGQKLQGSQLLSGPFPTAQGNESFGYASDESIAPRPYDPRLALALIAQATQAGRPASGGAAQEDDSPKAQVASVPVLLAHPAEPVARRACELIRQQLALAGIQVTLKEIKPNGGLAALDEVDLVYAELLMWEPLVDARRLLGADGRLGTCSPHVDLALRQLDQATQWPQACNVLRHIHRLVHQEATVIPLWQLPEHCAVHESLQGLPAAPVSTYDEVQQWQLSFSDPSQP